MSQNFNTEPYYDDYDKHKHFYKILFRPAYSLQTRELTQLQTMLQDQVSRMGDHIFKNGTMVIPGELSFDNELHYVKLQPTYNSISVSSFLNNLIGKVVSGGTSGIVAQVIAVATATPTDPDTIFVKYLDGGTSGSVKQFADNETIVPVDVALSSSMTQAASADATGIGSSAAIKEGVYYINGYFVLCEPQVLILDKYSNKPTYSVGFKITESVITPEEDETLLDNAQGSYNFAAPGAHRLLITLTLTKKTQINDVNDVEDYIQLVSLINGQAQNAYNQTQYAELAKVMARRTYDESGDYVVRDFRYAVHEHRSDNRGAWVAGKTYKEGDKVTRDNLNYKAKSDGIAGAGTGSWPTNELTEFDDGGVKWRFTTNLDYNGGIFTPEQGGLEDHIALAVEPGKAYVRGYEVEKVAMSYIQLQKARTTLHNPLGSIKPTVGNYVLVTRIHGIPDLSGMPIVAIYSAMTTTAGSASANGTLIGTARIRYFELHNGTLGTATAIYKVGLFNIALNTNIDFSRDVKQLFVDTGVTNTNFTADISEILEIQPGTVTMVSGTGIVTGTGTIFNSLKLKDVVSISGKLYRVTTKTSNSQITVAASPDALIDVTVGVSIYLVTTNILEPQNSNLIFQIGEVVKTARDNSNINQIKYTANQIFSGTTDGSGSITFNISAGVGNGNTFASPAIIGNYIATYGNGIIVDCSGITTLTASDKTCTIAFGGGLATTAIKIIVTLNKSGSIDTEKSKVLTYTSLEVTASAIGTARVVKLPNADGRRVYSVKMKGGTWLSPTGTYDIDITNRYMFDNGQTDAYYDLCSLTLIDGQQTPIAPFKIIYTYFTHSTSGDYFTVNSYSTPFELVSDYGNIPLGDCIDFRPRISDDGLTFSGSGASLSYLPKRGYNLSYECEFYIGRIDKLCVEPSGDFHIIAGTPSLNPAFPTTSSTGMLLNTITFQPYTVTTNDVSIKTEDNRRYTMRDIGKLETRINNLEYYSTLSMTEQNTTNMNILDSNGLNRYKNGFIVDSFNGHGIGNAQQLDYVCSVDSENKILRPFHTMKNITLFETDTANRVANNYMMTGDLITLPYTQVAILTQSFASRTENVNPFAVFTFVGQLNINPVSDDWFEGSRLPNIVINVEGNYNGLLTSLSNRGVLGTVWNAWRTIWAGSISTTITRTSTTSGGIVTAGVTRSMSRGRYGGWFTTMQPVRITSAKFVTNTTNIAYAQQIGQSISGLKTTIAQRIDTVLANEKIVSRDIIPYMRSRNISFVTQGLKSNTLFHGKFDGVLVDQYITPATKLTLNNVTGFSNIFDFTTNAGSNADHVARKIGVNLDLALNKGHILKGQTSGATAIILYQEPVIAGAAFVNLYVINIKGTFQSSEIVIGSLDGGTTGPRGTVASLPTILTKGSQLFSNYAGVACGVYDIPQNNAIKFRTGDRELILSDNILATPSTFAVAMYHAIGIHETGQSTFIATRNATVVQTEVSANRILNNQWSTSTSTTTQTGSASSVPIPPVAVGRRDPLAQTFLIDVAGGVFITKIDLFFSSKETIKSTPVSIEIREVVNGMPANRIAPFSQVYKDPVEVITSTTGTLPTTFTFNSPVFLNDGLEYALVILSDSNNYNVFISQMGEIDIATNKVISTQPTLGVLFKSSNGSTWTPNQLQDLKFVMYRALFNTAVTGYVNFSNSSTPTATLDENPFKFTSGSTVIRVSHTNHHTPVGSKTEISGAIDAAGVPANELNGQHVISNVENDSYTITVTTPATSTINGGGLNVIASENIQYDTLHVNTSELIFQNTSIEYQMKSTSGQSVNGIETPYIKEASFNTMHQNDNMFFSTPRMIASRLNEITSMSSAKSLDVLATLKSMKDNLSPVIDTQRLSGTAVSNLMNNPTLANINIVTIDDRNIINIANRIGFSATYNSIYTAIIPTFTASIGELTWTGNVATCTHTSHGFRVGDIFTITNATPTNYNGTWTVLASGFTADIFKFDLVIGSLASSSTSATVTNTNTEANAIATLSAGKYVNVASSGTSLNTGDHLVIGNTIIGSNRHVLLNSVTTDGAASADVITLIQHERFIDEICPMFGSALNKYISREIILAQPSSFLKIRLAASIPPTANVEIYYKTNPIGATDPLSTLNWILAIPTAPMTKTTNGTYTDIDYDIQNIASFDTVQVKIVMTGTSSSQVPTCKELRIIACA